VCTCGTLPHLTSPIHLLLRTIDIELKWAISDKLIDPKIVDMYVIFGGLSGAIIRDVITWLMALPTSSSHAIISGYAGAAIAKVGFGSLLLKGWAPVILFLFISPVIGFLLGYCFMVVTIWLSHSRERHKAERTFRHLQLLSAGAYSLGHGTNDAQRPWELSLRCWWQAERKNGR
jgi:PiT family inorganic phosphate transporter